MPNVLLISDDALMANNLSATHPTVEFTISGWLGLVCSPLVYVIWSVYCFRLWWLGFAALGGYFGREDCFVVLGGAALRGSTSLSEGGAGLEAGGGQCLFAVTPLGGLLGGGG